MAQDMRDTLTLAEELDLMDASKGKRILDGDIVIQKYVGSERVIRGERPEIYSFHDLETGAKVFVHNDPKITIGKEHNYVPNRMAKVMIEIAKSAEKIIAHAGSVVLFYKKEFSRYYPNEMLLNYALENLPGNHPIFRELDSEG